MKSLLKHALSTAVQNDYSWTILKATIVKGAEYATWERHRSISDHNGTDLEISKVLEVLSPDLTVQHGPFKGMKYPEYKSVGSSFFPKLLGSYERELHPVVENICKTKYSEIVDIGCAEGYYAVGLARRIKTAKVYAFDTNQEAVMLCQQMAELNGVADRLKLGKFCDADTMRALPLSKKALIISDCESYEKELFIEELVPFLAHHDLLIEIHDFMDIEISSTIRQRFQNTHEIKAIQSLDDITKVHSYDYKELRNFDLFARKMLLGEFRPAIMEWFYMTPLQG